MIYLHAHLFIAMPHEHNWHYGDVCLICYMMFNHRDFESLEERDVEKNNQLAFDVAEKEFGISPIMAGKEMSVVLEPDKLSMVMYLSQFYEMFKDTVPPGGEL